MKTGQAIGSTNRLGEYAKDRPVTFGEIFATLYHNLGIDTHRHHHRSDRPAAVSGGALGDQRVDLIRCLPAVAARSPRLRHGLLTVPP